MQFRTATLLSSAAMNADATSSAVLVDQVYGFAIETVAAGATAAGSLQVQGSLQDVKDGSSVTDWSNVGSAVSISGAGNSLTNFDAQYYKWMRVKFTKSTGASTDKLTVKFGLKGP